MRGTWVILRASQSPGAGHALGPERHLNLRLEFVHLASQEGANRRELCRRFGISAKTGSKCLEHPAWGGRKITGACTTRATRMCLRPAWSRTSCIATVQGREQRSVQQTFDAWRTVSNHERQPQALDMAIPVMRYRHSAGRIRRSCRQSDMVRTTS